MTHSLQQLFHSNIRSSLICLDIFILLYPSSPHTIHICLYVRLEFTLNMLSYQLWFLFLFDMWTVWFFCTTTSYTRYMTGWSWYSPMYVHCTASILYSSEDSEHLEGYVSRVTLQHCWKNISNIFNIVFLFSWLCFLQFCSDGNSYIVKNVIIVILVLKSFDIHFITTYASEWCIHIQYN